MQIDERLRIHEYANIGKLEDAIPLTRLRVKANVVAQARTAAALHTKTKTALHRRNAFFRHRAADLCNRLVSHLDAFNGGSRSRRRDRLGRVFSHSAHEPNSKLVHRQ